jgi:phosphate transport system protein
MPKRLQKEIERLKKSILAEGALVEEHLRMAVRSVVERNLKLAEQVIEADDEIDNLEVDLEEDCLKILALYQPVAIDLRFIIAVLKINNDLERIGDLCVNIAEDSLFLAGHEKIEIPFDFPAMSEKVQAMLRNSLDALVNMDAPLAFSVCAADDEVDEINRDMYEKVEDGIKKYPAQLAQFVRVISVSRRLERIADHATNIAMDIIYMVEGEIVRHGRKHEKNFCERTNEKPASDK